MLVQGTREHVLKATPQAVSDLSPVAIMERAGKPADPWQRALLETSARRVLMLCARQSGKSLATAALLLSEALRTPDSLHLVVCPAERQSKEFLVDKVLRLYRAIGQPLATGNESTLHLTLANGSRILALPGNEATLRGFSGAATIVLDEAARIPDPLYYSLRPVLAVSGGRLLGLTTPFGKRGWFYEAWQGEQAWQRIKITAHECPRITPEFLAEERITLGEVYFNSEYLCSFEDVVFSLFGSDDIEAAVTPGLAAIAW
jgi:hypothetical protein